MKKTYDALLRIKNTGLDKIDIVNSIIEEYQEQGYKLTLRQLYYQLVTREVIPNEQKEYSKLSSLLVKGRMAGLVDWDAIEDRIRQPKIPYWVTGVDDAIEDTIRHYRLDRMSTQECYIELWCEKDALSGVLSGITSHYHIRLMVNRGYGSCTAMYEAAKRFRGHADDACILLYLGDHDPSGLDMVRDIQRRLMGFGAGVLVEHIALTDQQVEKYAPPPNPAKISDPRAKWYIGKYGNTSWEVDALNPKTLNEIVKDNVEKYIDLDLFAEILKQEEYDKRHLRDISDRMNDDE